MSYIKIIDKKLLMLIILIICSTMCLCFPKNLFILYFLLGVLILIRLDLLIFVFFFFFYNLITDKQFIKKHILFFLFFPISFLIVHTIFRLIYYDDILPNTYYLKMTGYPFILRILRGLYVFIYNCWRSNIILFIIPFLSIFLTRDKRLHFLLLIFCIMSCYSIYVGGDAWEWWGGANRYYVFILPLYFILFCFTIDNILNRIFKNPIQINIFIIIITVFSVILLNAFQGIDSLKILILKKPALYIEDQNPAESLLIKSITKNTAIIGIGPAGLTPYFSERNSIDFLGKNDRYIARLQMKKPAPNAEIMEKIKFFFPGHLKFDHNYSIIQKKPDVCVGCYSINDENIKLFLEKNYLPIKNHDVALLKNSSNIIWEKAKLLINK